MKLAFSTNAFTRHPLEFALQEIARAGYAGVEILADKPHWYPETLDFRHDEAIRSLLEKLDLKVSNINANCTFGYFNDAPPEAFFEPSLISPDGRMRADRIRMIQNTLRFAHFLGAENISITSGKALPTMPPEKAAKQLRESLKPVLELAERLGVHVGFECEPGLFVEWATELRALIDDLGSPMLGANLDIGHSIVMGEDIPDTLELLRGRIWNCHIEDLLGRKHYHLIPGTGTLDWDSLHDALRENGYDRFLTVELYSYPDRPIEAATESAVFLKTLFS
ncbi:MAG TPA: sugar phosphate isomerase/epimerase [Phycisphaerae bacterium]|nr:sugar phosphate isomerase/epimerase [Phycisphaerae bacterium]